VVLVLRGLAEHLADVGFGHSVVDDRVGAGGELVSEHVGDPPGRVEGHHHVAEALPLEGDDPVPGVESAVGRPE
jgi:hypothetical protein